MTGPAATAPRRRARGTLQVDGIVLRRSDVRESSRIVTLLTREHGRLTGLAKGAHRPDSPLLGRIDFLNEVRATFSPDRGGLRLFERAELLQERRALRQPLRFLAASHVAWLAEFTLPAGRPDPAAYDLLAGGLALVERCPAAAVGTVVLGLELRYLALLGALPDLRQCVACGAPLADGAFRAPDQPGLCCRRDAGPSRQVVPGEVLALLDALHTSTGRQWPKLGNARLAGAAAPLPASWLAVATEQRPRLRALLFERA